MQIKAMVIVALFYLLDSEPKLKKQKAISASFLEKILSNSNSNSEKGENKTLEV
jgi:hypothetical protein